MCDVPAMSMAGMAPPAKQAMDVPPSPADTPPPADKAASAGCGGGATGYDAAPVSGGGTNVIGLLTTLTQAMTSLQAIQANQSNQAASSDSSDSDEDAPRIPIPLASVTPGTAPVMYDPFVQELQAATMNGGFEPWTPSF